MLISFNKYLQRRYKATDVLNFTTIVWFFTET